MLLSFGQTSRNHCPLINDVWSPKIRHITAKQTDVLNVKSSRFELPRKFSNFLSHSNQRMQITEPPPSFEDCIEDGKNKYTVTCQFCPSRMLSPSTASHVTNEHMLPLMTQKKAEVTTENGEHLKDFWVVDDMFTFENIGFTHTVDDIKYLSCADCERGPVGYHLLSTKKSYLALARVKNRE